MGHTQMAATGDDGLTECQKEAGLYYLDVGGYKILWPHMTWQVQLYLVTLLIAAVSMIIGIYNSAKHLHIKPSNERVVMKWLLTAAFSMKVPYFTDKPVAMCSVVILAGGYFIMAVIDTIRITTAKGSRYG